jgi:hypothetical protein
MLSAFSLSVACGCSVTSIVVKGQFLLRLSKRLFCKGILEIERVKMVEIGDSQGGHADVGSKTKSKQNYWLYRRNYPVERCEASL